MKLSKTMIFIHAFAFAKHRSNLIQYRHSLLPLLGTKIKTHMDNIMISDDQQKWRDLR